MVAAMKSYTLEFIRAALRCAIRGEWRAAWMYVKWARAQIGPLPF